MKNISLRTKRILFNLICVLAICYFIVDSELKFRELSEYELQDDLSKAFENNNNNFLLQDQYRQTIDYNESLGGTLRVLFWNMLNIVLFLLLLLLVHLQEKDERKRKIK